MAASSKPSDGTPELLRKTYCNIYIYVWVKSWRVREWFGRPWAVVIIIASRLELIGIFRGGLLGCFRGSAGMFLGIAWDLAAIAMLIQHKLLRDAVLRHQKLLESVLSLLRLRPWDSGGARICSDEAKSFLFSLLVAIEKPITPLASGKMAKDGRILFVDAYVKGVVLKARGNQFVSYTSNPSDDPHFSRLSLPKEASAAGVCAKEKAIIYIPSVKYTHGVRVEEVSSIQRRDWNLSIIESAFFRRTDIGFKSLLCAPILVGGEVWGVLVLAFKTSSACRKFHFDAISIAAQFAATHIAFDSRMPVT